MALDKEYDSKIIEPKWVKRWEEEKTYKFNPKSKKPFYSIDTPPPTVSGRMHIGHAGQYTRMDVIARFKRMQGYELFYPFGTDDNGLPTERLVEKLKNVKAVKMKRDDFVKLCWQTLKQETPAFVQDWKNIGMSCDFSLFYSTIDKHCQKISQRSFIELYEQGREYLKEAPNLWCPLCETAIAQVELEDKEIDSLFVDVKFKLEDGKDLIIATTRPEMFAACVAVFANPNDKRYKDLIGKKAKTPLYDIWVPIIADEKADPEKGTGIVMCCTFGDQTDIEWYKQYNLPEKVIITKDGKLNEKAGKYAGLAVKEVRKQVIEELEKQGLLVGKRAIKHMVNVHERCGTEIEILVSKQWFVKYLDLKEEFLKQGSKVKWLPDFMKTRYDNWVKGLKWDWCISRQRFFGVPIPVWYCKKCSEVIIADKNKLPVDPLVDSPSVTSCPKCGCKELIPEKDIFDTWPTSALTPKLAIELLNDSKLKNKLYPMDMRCNSHDIITFWDFNTIVKSYLHDNSIPWKNLMISGWLLDAKGEKMSKSKGNVITPEEITKEYSSDALRFWVTISLLGEDIRYEIKELIRGKKFLTKLWNAAKMVSLHETKGKTKKEELSDLWILARLNEVIKNSTNYLENYDYSHAKKETVDFFFSEYCDNYLEMIKHRLYGKNTASKNSAIKVSKFALECILKLMAPFTPFITEEIWRELFDSKKSIHIQEWPKVEKKFENKQALEKGKLLVELIGLVRKYKSEKQMSMKDEINKAEIFGLDKDKEIEDELKNTCNIKEIEFKKGKEIKITF